MSDEMTHDAAREALEALALDALDASERDAVMAHVAECTTCQSELAALENTAGELALAAAPLAMRPGQRDRIRARLVARAAADRASSQETAMPAPPALRVSRGAAAAPAPRAAGQSTRRYSNAFYWALAASAMLVASVATILRVQSQRDYYRQELRTAAAERGRSAAAADSLRASLEDKDRMIANLTGPQVAVMTLASAGPESPTGRMFWDQSHDAWTFVAHHVPSPKPGRTYQLWLVTPTAKISAGTFAPSANGEVMVRAKYALGKDSLAAVAVTDEPGAGSAQPTTAPFLVASK